MLQEDGLGVLEVRLKTLDVAVVRSAPAINGLVFVAYHIQIAVVLRQAAQNGILGEVRILKLIHQNVFKFVRPGAARLWISAHDLVGVHQHVIEVHGVVAD